MSGLGFCGDERMMGQRDRMPGPWKIVSVLLSVLLTLITGIFLWLNGSIADTKIQLAQESRERAEAQRKTDVTSTEIKGKADKLEQDVKRVEDGLKELKGDLKDLKQSNERNFEKVLERLQQRGRIP